MSDDAKHHRSGGRAARRALRTAPVFYMPKLFDNNSFEQWKAEASEKITVRSLKYPEKLLRDYEEPKLDQAIDDASPDFLARRRREIPAYDTVNTNIDELIAEELSMVGLVGKSSLLQNEVSCFLGV